MNRFLLPILLSSLVIGHSSFAASPLRVFIRSGPKSHGPGAHDHPSFLRDWVPLLNERGVKASGGDDFPTKEQLDQTDVIIIHRDGGGDFKPEERALMDAFTQRGGGIVVIHAGSVANKPEDSAYYKNLIGGSWLRPQTKWLEGPMNLYFTDHHNPITRDCANFEMDDEIYYDMDISPEVHVLAAAYTPKAQDTGGKGNKEAQARAAEAVKKGGVNIYDIQPQVWTYEKSKYRAFVCIPGHHYTNFSHPVMRALILRGVAWAGKRENVDELLKPAELGENLRYVEGGPTRPEKAAEKLEVHPEFNISLVASEPLINKAMNIDWDEKGRLWVCETPEYPNGRRRQNTDPWKDAGSLYPGKFDREPQDRISWLEDTNGDGVMDKKHVFADKLELVTSFCFYKNGVIACSAPDIWFLEDTDGDGVCDKRTKLYTGLGIRDTHAVINNLRWGLDGWIYATHGYSDGDVQSLGDKSQSSPTTHIGSGVVRFKPDGTQIEQYSSRGGNTWGLCMTWNGQCFWTQPTSGTVFFHTVLPESVLAKGKIPGTNSYKGMITGQKAYPLMSWPNMAYVQIDLVGSYTAAAGCAIYEGGAWPEKWNYSYFVGEPTLNIVSHYFVKPDGVSYTVEKEKGREQTEFIRSKDMWFRPIEERVGPDGALYVVDFYNQAVIHNDTRGPLHGPTNAAVRPDRDHYYGRIWKLQHKDAKKLEVPVLQKGNPDDLLGVIKSSPNGPLKSNAWRLLREHIEGTDPKGRFWDKNRDVAFPIVGSKAMEAYVAPTTSVKHSYNSAINGFLAASDDWTRSAFIAKTSDRAVDCIVYGIESEHAPKIGEFVSALLPFAFQKEVAENVSELLAACAAAPSSADGLKKTVLDGIARRDDVVLRVDSGIADAFKKLLANPATAGAALPLISKWDKNGALAGEVKSQLASLKQKLADKSTTLTDRISAAQALIAVGGDSLSFVVPALAGTDTPGELKAAIIQSLGEAGHPELIVASFDSMGPGLRNAAFEQILKRAEATQAFLNALNEGKIKSTSMGPTDAARLRTHPNKNIARQANAMLDKLVSPATKEKNAIIAKLTPEVERPGNLANGKLLFTATCSLCHKLGDIGKDVAPPLTGMGAHGPAELLVHVVDPNREVDPSFVAWNITKKSGEILVGVIGSENPASLTLKTQTGDVEIRKDDIKTRENTHRSLMPEGFEALPPEVLRDILAFICGDAMKQFRILHLTEAYTADSREGVFKSSKPNGGTVRLAKFGDVNIQGIPFFIQDPAKSATGSNLIVLKGGPKDAHSQSYPAKVEVPVNVETKRLQLLSGISGWGYPAVKDDSVAVNATVVYASGEKETFALKNGVAFADYIRPVEVPDSQYVEGLTEGQQMRLLTLKLTKKGVAKSLVLESPQGNRTVPVIAAITADIEGKVDAKGKDAAPPPSKGGTPAPSPSSAGASAPATGPKEGGKGDGPLLPATPPNWESGKTKVLLIGGGSSHNFQKFFGESDSATLKAAGLSVHYTEDRDQAAAELKNADVAVISVNRKFFDTPAYRKALMDFANSGKGLVMMHPGTWYGFADWPELNAKIVGGGARGHDAIDKFTVSVLKKDHPVMKGVPATFEATDELYYINAEPEKIPAGTAPIEILAQTSPSKKFQKPHPSVWITQHDKARIVGIALGHDERVHDMEAFKTILTNAVRWVSGK